METIIQQILTELIRKITEKAYEGGITDIDALASDGILKSPLGETATEPTFGPSGKHERLNC